MDISGMNKAVETINKVTIPEMTKELNALVDRLEGLLNRLDGLSVVVVMGGEKK